MLAINDKTSVCIRYTSQPIIQAVVNRKYIILISCNAHHNRDEAASRNIRAEGIRMLKADGAAVSASRGPVRQDRQRTCAHVRKTKVMQHPAKLETTSSR